MKLFDIINALFQVGGALAAWKNAYQLHKDRQIKGVYWPVYVFFSIWGLWNLLYYPALGQWWSFGAGLLLVAGNLAWVIQAMRVKRLERDDEHDPRIEKYYVVGQQVLKHTGDYQLAGEVRAVFTTKKGRVRYVVEHEPGFLHIYSDANLKPLQDQQ